MVATPEEIVNLGFDAIGEKPIVSITGPTTTAEKFAARHYAPARDALLRRHIWTFAKRWVKLIANANKTLDADHPWAYKIPAESVRVIRPSDADWHVVGRELYSGISGGLTIAYMANNTSPADFDPLFVDALAYFIAMRFAEARTQSANKKNIATGLFRQAIHDAKTANALEEPSRDVFHDHAASYLAGHDGQAEAGLARRAVLAGGS